MAKASAVAGVHTGSSISAASVQIAFAGGGDLEAGLAGGGGAGRDAQLDAIAGRHDDALPGAGGEHRVLGAGGEVDLEGGVGLVLEDDRQLEAITLVEEARRRGARHQRAAGGDRRPGPIRSGARRPRPPPSPGNG